MLDESEMWFVNTGCLIDYKFLFVYKNSQKNGLNAA